MPANSLIELQDVSKIYRMGDEDTVALSHVNLTVTKGEFIAVIGASGSGKSTLMNIIGLLDRPTSGRYLLDYTDVGKLSKRRLSAIRNRQIGFVFQQFNLLPRTTVFDNVLLPTIYGRIEDAKPRAKALIEELGLGTRLNYWSNQLSGGQIQRVAIARALVMEPSIILADEPTGNLDTKTSQEIMEILAKINREGSTIVLITHEAHIAAYAHRVIELADGKIAA
jgi:putative ABC transport system ATP-binding protein